MLCEGDNAHGLLVDRVYCSHIPLRMQAYQILSNEQLRTRYDAKQDVSSDTDLMASGDFFAMLFGSMRFEEFVGELMISSLAREGGAIDGEKVYPQFFCQLCWSPIASANSLCAVNFV